MPQLLEENVAENFSRFERETVAVTRPGVDALRKAAMARFNEVGFPTRRDEEWRFTNVDAITKTAFTLAEPNHDADAVKHVQATSFGKDAACELVFINGHYVEQLSQTRQTP